MATNKPPLGAYRGVGMTMGAFTMERLMDLLAERLGLDPAEIRRRNFIPRDAYPFTSASGIDLRQRRLSQGAGARAGAGRLRRPAPRAAGGPRRRAPRGHRPRRLHRVHRHGLRGVPSTRDEGRARRRGRHRHDGPRRERALRAELPVAGAGTRDHDRPARRRPAGRAARARAARAVGHRGRAGRQRHLRQPRRGGHRRHRGGGRRARSRARLQALAGHRSGGGRGRLTLEAGRAYVRGFPERAVTISELARLASLAAARRSAARD